MKIKLFIGVGTACAVLGYAAWCIVSGIFTHKGINLSDARRYLIVAHRGGAGIAPENTLKAMESGIEAGADMLEIDIHQTLDNAIVVCHDATVDRTTDGHGKISEMTLVQIQALRIKNADGSLTDQHIPTLDEVLELVGNRAYLLVEVKHARGQYPGIESRMVEAFLRHDAIGRVVVQSFSDEVLAKTHAIAPELRLEKLLICRLWGVPALFDGNFTSFNYEKYPHIASFNFYVNAVTRHIIDDMHAHGKEVKIWTLDSPESAPDFPVDGIITDRPDLWKKESGNLPR